MGNPSLYAGNGLTCRYNADVTHKKAHQLMEIISNNYILLTVSTYNRAGIVGTAGVTYTPVIVLAATVVSRIIALA